MSITPKLADILTARGLDLETMVRYGFDGTSRDGVDTLVIPFARNGKTVRRKYRQFEGERKWSQDKGGVRCAWNEDVLRDDSLIGQPLLITEGELDALAAIQAGFLRTISVPDGAPPPGERTKEDLEESQKYAWLKDIEPFLISKRVGEIIICADGDENGAALLQDLSIRIGKAACKFIRYPKSKKDRGRSHCKDLNEVLEDYGVPGVQKTIATAQWIAAKGVYTMSELPPMPEQARFDSPNHRLFSENFKLRLGDFSVVTGTPGFGKTSFVNDIMCSIAEWADLKICWASFEQAPQVDHKRNLRGWYLKTPQHRADPRDLVRADEWINRHHLFIYDEHEDLTLEWLLEAAEIAVVRHGAKIIIIDPWNEVEHCRQQGETETDYIGRAIRTLKRFARGFNVHVCVVAHPTKSVKDGDGNYKMPSLYDISGSSNWYNKADLGVIVHRKDDENTLIKVQKSRYHDIIGKPGEVLMQFSVDERRFIESERLS